MRISSGCGGSIDCWILQNAKCKMKKMKTGKCCRLLSGHSLSSRMPTMPTTDSYSLWRISAKRGIETVEAVTLAFIQLPVKCYCHWPKERERWKGKRTNKFSGNVGDDNRGRCVGRRLGEYGATRLLRKRFPIHRVGCKRFGGLLSFLLSFLSISFCIWQLTHSLHLNNSNSNNIVG